MKCPNCGENVKDDELFCANCGHKIIRIKEETTDHPDLEIKNEEVQQEVNETTPKVVKTPFYKKIIEKLSKKVIAGIVVGVVAIVIGVVVYTNINSDYNKFKNAYKDGNSKEMVSIIKEMDESDQKKVQSYLDGKIQSLHDDYYNGKITYDDLKDDIGLIRAGYVGNLNKNTFNSLYNEISDLNESQSAYATAETCLENKDYEGAYTYYNKVIEEDPNYEDAQSKLDSFKADYANSLYEEAKQYYDSKDYTNALSKIEDAIEINSTDEYTQLKDSINKKIEEEKAAKEEAARQALLLKSGKIINTSDVQITFNSAQITSAIYPNDTSGYYQYYSPGSSDNLMFDMVFTLKNTSNSITGISQVTSATLKYGSSSYTSYEEYYCYPGSSDIDKVYSWDGFESLNTVTYHVVFNIPKSASSDSKSIKATVTIDGTTYTLEYR